MKGGVTSGVVYPRAITTLSREYQFSSIGGTSAGAIAAAVTAAAEYARANGKDDSFEQVNELPTWLGGTSADGKHSNLFHLFQPMNTMADLYQVVVAGLGKTGAKKWASVLFAAFRVFPIASLVGTLPGIFAAFLSQQVSADWLTTLGYIFSLALMLTGSLIAIVLAMLRSISRIPVNGWGICSGMTENSGINSPALVPWLSEYLDTLAGKAKGEPLTFGDLQKQGINLRMITTDLTNGRPYSLPFGEHTHFYFHPDELKRFFPEYVVRWMIAHQGTPSSREKHGEVDRSCLAIFPDASNLPIVVAVRMSLSFPFLFSPVPLYGVDFGFGPKTSSEGRHVPEPCYFVDGGIANNFPLNLFDRSLPRWPTFGINLRNLDVNRHKQEVYMPCRNSGGLEEWWTRFDTNKGLGGLISFFGLLFDTSRNWRDNLQLGVPGYRDRVAHIGLNPAKEGGMNLDMPEDIINLLTGRGQRAGGAILSRYSPTADYPQDPNCVVGLDNQKWTRFYSFMEQLEDVLLSMDESIPYSGDGEPTYDDLLNRATTRSYPMSQPQRHYAATLLGDLMKLVPEIAQARSMGHSFETKAPRPEPNLVVTPHF